jgi:hypothetical protein
MSDDADVAQETEERDRRLALRVRKPEGPPACGYCHNCSEPVRGGERWCDDDCRDDWERRA